MRSAIAAVAADGDFSAADENEVYKNKNTGENRTIIEIPLFDETDKKKNKEILILPLKTPLRPQNGGRRGVFLAFSVHRKSLCFPVKTDYNERDRNHDRKPD